MSALPVAKGCAEPGVAARRGWHAAAALVLAAHGSAAAAADVPGPVRWSGTLVVASDTIRRGVTWSGGRAAVGAELGATTDQGWSASLALDSPAYPEIGGRVGWTLAASRQWQLDADWSAQGSLARYAFTGRRAARDASDLELGVTAAWQGRVFVGLAVAPDRRSYDVATRETRSGSTAALDLGATQRLAGRLSLDAGVGYASVGAARRRGYLYGSIGLRWGVGPVQAQFGWVASQAERRGVVPRGEAGTRVLAAASLTF